MDALAIQWGWFGGNPTGGPTPPTPPAPADDGDAAFLVGLSRRDDLAEERYYWRRKFDPWALIRQWAQDLTQPARAESDAAAARRHWVQVARVTRITRMTRRRR